MIFHLHSWSFAIMVYGNHVLLHASMYLCDFDKHRPCSLTFNIKNYECVVI